MGQFVELAEALVNADPSDGQYQRMFGGALYRRADVEIRIGDTAAATT